MWHMAEKGLFTTFRSLNLQHSHGKWKSWHGRQRKKSKQRKSSRAAWWRWNPDPWGFVSGHCLHWPPLPPRHVLPLGTKAWFYDSWHFGPQQGRNIGVEMPNKAGASKGRYLLWEYFLEWFHLPVKCQQELIFLDQVTQKHPCILHGHCPVFPCGPGAPKQSWTSVGLTSSQGRGKFSWNRWCAQVRPQESLTKQLWNMWRSKAQVWEQAENQRGPQILNSI